METKKIKKPEGGEQPEGVKFKAETGIKLPGKYDDKAWTKLFKKGFKVRMECPKCGYSEIKKVKYAASPLIFLLILTIIGAFFVGPIYAHQKSEQQLAVKLMKEEGTLHLKGKNGAVCPKCKDALMVYTILEVPEI